MGNNLIINIIYFYIPFFYIFKDEINILLHYCKIYLFIIHCSINKLVHKDNYYHFFKLSFAYRIWNDKINIIALTLIIILGDLCT